MSESEKILHRMRYFERPYSEVKTILHEWWERGYIDEGEYLRLRLMAFKDCEKR